LAIRRCSLARSGTQTSRPRKGAFVLTADAARTDWKTAGPFFGGWELYDLKGSPADPKRIQASQCSGRFGHGMMVLDPN